MVIREGRQGARGQARGNSEKKFHPAAAAEL